MMRFHNRLWASLVLMCVLLLAYSAPLTAQDDPQARKETVLRLIEEGWNRGNGAVVDEIFSPDYMSHPDGGDREALRQAILAFRTALPDLRLAADPLLAEADWVAFYLMGGGTFEQDLVLPQGTIPATGQPADVRATIIVRFNQTGQWAEAWVTPDHLGWLQPSSGMAAQAANVIAVGERRIEPDYTMTMAGGQEVPGPGDEDGAGTALVAVNEEAQEVCWQIQVANISLPATAAHIHEAPPGDFGDPVIMLTAPDENGWASGCAVVDDPLLIANIRVVPGDYYVNVHTTDFPDGAVHGQFPAG